MNDVYKTMIDTLHRQLSANGVDSDRAAAVAMETIAAVSKEIGGQRLYLPKRPPWFSKDRRDDTIKREFNGRNYRTIARAFCLSERTIRRICKT